MRLLGLAIVVLCVSSVGCGRLGFDELDDGVTDPSDPPSPFDPSDPFAPDAGGAGDGSVGPSGATMLRVDRQTFNRHGNTFFPATTSDFMLDRYEVTVARFRAFVASGRGTRATAPTAGDGAHPAVAGSGWQNSWSSLLALDSLELVDRIISITNPTFTPNPGANDEMPIVGVTWYEAFAFCIWDGKRLPTVAEHEAAAFGGEEQRPYPWGSTFDATLVAGGDALEPIGKHSPGGDARWGHADLVGNADEWALDFFGSLPQPCVDCAQLVPQTTPTRVQLGGSYFSNTSDYGQAAGLHGMGPNQRNGLSGFRCAFSP